MWIKSPSLPPDPLHHYVLILLSRKTDCGFFFACLEKGLSFCINRIYVRFIGERVDASFSRNFALFEFSPHISPSMPQKLSCLNVTMSLTYIERFLFCFSVKSPRKMGFKYPHATCSMMIFSETPKQAGKV